MCHLVPTKSHQDEEPAFNNGPSGNLRSISMLRIGSTLADRTVDCRPLGSNPESAATVVRSLSAKNFRVDHCRFLNMDRMMTISGGVTMVFNNTVTATTYNCRSIELSCRWPNPAHTERQAEILKEGRDFFNEAPEADYYRPFTSPHPLQGNREARSGLHGFVIPCRDGIKGRVFSD
jgi:hypothetical protein